MTLDPNHLWAKSQRWDEPVHPSMALGQHLQDVYEAAVRVLDATGDDQLTALGLEPNVYRDRLRNIVLLAAACHDLGKANDHFQAMIRGKRNIRENPQGLRHEWASLLILQELRPWLLSAVGGNARDFSMVEWAVSGHHPAHNHPSPPKNCPPGAGAELALLTDHEDFRAILRWLATTFHLQTEIPLVTTRNYPLTGIGSIFQTICNWSKTATREWETSVKHTPDRQLVAAAKNCLIAADVAGSALPNKLPTDPHRWDWITQSFDSKPLPQDLNEIVKLRLGNATPRPFQQVVADSTSSVTFVKAGCGSGKTLAAYMWAAKNHPHRRLYFCYPTTGTATEGFKDYLHEAGVRADLFHSRREVDFEIILNSGQDEEQEEIDAAIRIEALDAWSTPIVACTVDMALGLVQNNKRGLFSWPALAQSAFVFDEIHAYDDKLFGALLRFLRDLPGLPVLLMTASLPEPRLTALTNTLNRHRQIQLAPISGPVDLEQLPRYHKCKVSSNDPLPLVRDSYMSGGKVLWVCNTVQRVIDAGRAAEAAGLKPFLYHSRFKYEHRVQQHKKVVHAFSSNRNDAALAICSQVAEMSLDLKGCTLLVTDLATVPALIQRLGRLNRQAEPGGPTMPFIVVEPDHHLPYSQIDLEAAQTWLGKLSNDGISQRQLAECWEQSAENPPELVASAWLDGGPATNVSELREASLGITVLMAEDIPTIQTQPKLLGRYTLPMPMPKPPNSMKWHNWPRYRGIPTAEAGSINYDKERGAIWAK